MPRFHWSLRLSLRAIFTVSLPLVLMLSGMLVLRNYSPYAAVSSTRSQHRVNISTTSLPKTQLQKEAYKNITIKSNRTHSVENVTKNGKTWCRSLPEYNNNTAGIGLDSKVVGGVVTMVIFIGYARSGHSLIGLLLDAHPNMVIANEYDILERWKDFSASKRNKHYLFNQLYLNSYKEANKGDRSSENCLYKTKYNYKVPNQWQGRFNHSIKVIGDKKGGRTSVQLRTSMSKLKEIIQAVKVSMKFIHMVRNPFDTIATMWLRNFLPYDYNRKLLDKNPLNISRSSQTKRAKYFTEIARFNYELTKRFEKSVITIRSEEVIENPRQQLLNLCAFLNVSCLESFLKDCASIVHSKPSRTRDLIFLEKEAVNIIRKGIQDIPFFQHYTFYD